MCNRILLYLVIIAVMDTVQARLWRAWDHLAGRAKKLRRGGRGRWNMYRGP